MPPPAATLPTVPLPALLGVYLRLGLASFGGGLSGWIYREMVVRRAWLDEQTYLTGLTLAQILPGGNAVNLALYAGLSLRGGLGAAMAILGMILPPFLLIVLLGALYDRFGQVPSLRAITGGIAAVGVGMVLSTGLRTGRALWRDWPLLAVAVLTFIAIGLLHLPLLPVIAVLTPASVLIAYRTPRAAG